MVYVLIVAGILILVIVGIAVIVSLNYRTVSIAELKSQGKVKEIIEIFHDQRNELQRRKQALTVLGELKTPEAMEALIIGLIQNQDPIQPHLLLEIKKIGPAIYPSLGKAFQRPNNRLGALRAMMVIGPAAAEILFPFLEAPNPALRNMCYQALDQIGWIPTKDAFGAMYWIVRKQPQKCAEIGSAAVPALMEALKDPALCLDVIETLGEIRDPIAGQALLELSKNSRYSVAVIKAMSKWREAGEPVLLVGLKGSDFQIRQTALSILDLIAWKPTPDESGARYWAMKHRWNKCIELGNPAVTPLIELINDKDKQVRKDVLHTLGLLGQEAAVDDLVKILKDPDVEIQQAAVEALGHIKSAKAMDALFSVLKEETLYPGNVNALVEIGQIAVEPLTAVLRLPDLTMRRRTAEVLERLAWSPETEITSAAFSIARQDWETCFKIGKPAVDLLIQELGHPFNCVNAVKVLARIGDTRAIPPIIAAFADKPLTTQQALADALGGMGSAAVDPLLVALNSGKIELLPVIRALGVIGDERAARPLTGFLSDTYPVSVREAAAAALGCIGLPAFEPILEAMKHTGLDPKTTGIALGGAGKLGWRTPNKGIEEQRI